VKASEGANLQTPFVASPSALWVLRLAWRPSDSQTRHISPMAKLSS
jgi:hypothetical protein